MKRFISTTVAILFSVVLITVSSTANAETVRKRDPQPRCSQVDSLDVNSATFTYSDDVFEVTLKMGALSRKRTQVFGRYMIGNRPGDEYGVQLVTKYVDGNRRTVGYWPDYEAGDFANRLTKGLKATWDWSRRTVKFELTDYLRGQRVFASAYSVAKGEPHGPPCGDYIAVRSLSRD